MSDDWIYTDDALLAAVCALNDKTLQRRIRQRLAGSGRESNSGEDDRIAAELAGELLPVSEQPISRT